MDPIPVLRPSLPSAKELLPYLERIDASRIYSNWGPLVEDFSRRLARRLGLNAECIVCANSGTSALVGAILATAGRASSDRPYAVIPDFTFVATALAVQSCGYEVVVAGCRSDGWDMHPGDLANDPNLLDRVGLVVPVAPFGRIVSQEAWTAFQERTGIPVVIDAAASFDLLQESVGAAVGRIPIALSFHATKSFGVGEGGAVITTDAAVAARSLQCLNFGFFEGRHADMASINGKMPEHVAAVGLAELDRWNRKHHRLLRMFERYVEACGALGIRLRLWGPPDISCGYVLLQCDSATQARGVVEHLERERIGTRFWYGSGVRGHPAFRGCRFLDLYPQRTLDPGCLVGLPVAPDLPLSAIRRVARAVHAGLERVAASGTVSLKVLTCQQNIGTSAKASSRPANSSLRSTATTIGARDIPGQPRKRRSSMG
jgi:dTDP-4-amino-4,6-dideoxygalactose transaminase